MTQNSHFNIRRKFRTYSEICQWTTIAEVVREQGTPLQQFMTAEKLKIEVRSVLEQLKQDISDESKFVISFNFEDIFKTVENALTQFPDPAIQISTVDARVDSIDVYIAYSLKVKKNTLNT